MADKAPHLNEVEFKLWWHLYTSQEIGNSQLLHSDLFELIKEQYPIREINGNEFTFSQDKSTDSILTRVVLSQTEIRLISNDTEYKWKNFKDEIKFICDKMFLLFEKHLSLDHIHIMLNYQDFFNHDFDNGMLDFLSAEMKVQIKPSFIDNSLQPDRMHLSLRYPIELGKLTIQSNTGILNNQKGIVLMTQVDSRKEVVNIDVTQNWIDKAHDLCSALYKNILK